MTIFEITKEHLDLVALLEENEGEVSEEQESRIFELIKNGEDKVISLYYVWKNKEVELAGVKKEIERIGGIKKRLESEMDRIKRIIEMYMRFTGTEKIKRGVIDINMAKKTNFVYAGEFPDSFKVTEQVIKEELGKFKEWAKENPEQALELYGAKFVEDKAVRLK